VGFEGEILGVAPGALDPAAKRPVVEIDCLADLVRREQLGARQVRQPDLVGTALERAHGGGDEIHRHPQRLAGRKLGNRRQVAGLEDFGPEIGVAQIPLRDLPDGLVRLETDFDGFGPGDRDRSRQGKRRHGQPIKSCPSNRSGESGITHELPP
jgi:hypothetical protein